MQIGRRISKINSSTIYLWNGLSGTGNKTFVFNNVDNISEIYLNYNFRYRTGDYLSEIEQTKIGPLFF